MFTSFTRILSQQTPSSSSSMFIAVRRSSALNFSKQFTYSLSTSKHFFSSSSSLHNNTTPLYQTQTYYSLFPKTFPNGPPPDSPFKLDRTLKSQLKQEYLKIQALTHPDTVGPNASAETQREAENQSAKYSIAYRTLLSPLRRAQHLIACRTGAQDPLSEESGRRQANAGDTEDLSSQQQQQPDVNDSAGIDEDFLMDVLMARESSEEATSAEELHALIEENNARIKETEELLQEAFCNYKGDQAEEGLRKAIELTRKLSYWEGIDRQLQESLDVYE